jgi:ubiquinone/menaquinone biosynthesis C-methylase UbiE
MKMGTLEKYFVNSDNHRRRVATQGVQLLQRIDWQPGQRYLDFGCGVGAAAIQIARNFPLAVTGVDIDPAQIQIACEAGEGLTNLRFLTNIDTSLPFADQIFDIVATNKVMHHIPNWIEALAELDRVLVPGGYLIYSDFVLPAFLVGTAQLLLDGRLGFPTKNKINTCLAERTYAARYLANSGLNFVGIFQKSGSLPIG